MVMRIQTLTALSFGLVVTNSYSADAASADEDDCAEISTAFFPFLPFASTAEKVKLFF